MAWRCRPPLPCQMDVGRGGPRAGPPSPVLLLKRPVTNGLLPFSLTDSTPATFHPCQRHAADGLALRQHPFRALPLLPAMLAPSSAETGHPLPDPVSEDETLATTAVRLHVPRGDIRFQAARGLARH